MRTRRQRMTEGRGERRRPQERLEETSNRKFQSNVVDLLNFLLESMPEGQSKDKMEEVLDDIDDWIEDGDMARETLDHVADFTYRMIDDWKDLQKRALKVQRQAIKLFS